MRPWFPRKRDPRVLLVRYEDLRSDPAELERVATFLGLGPSATWLKTPVDAPPEQRSSTVVRGDAAIQQLNPYDAAGFSNHERQDRRELTRYETAYITMRCRAELKVLGYPVEVDGLPARLRAEHIAAGAALEGPRPAGDAALDRARPHRVKSMTDDTAKARGIRALRRVGIDVYALRRRQQGRRAYKANKAEFLRQMPGSATAAALPLGNDYPCLFDRFDTAGTARGHYFHQDLLVAQWIHAAAPRRHVDVGSRIDGFVAHVASFRPIEVVDIRPLASTATNIVFRRRDITVDEGTDGDAEWDACCDSLSCLHALEHFGLGRYGDPVAVDGWLAGWRNLVRMVEPGGVFYFSTPIGPQRVEFDAHRVFSVPFLRDLVAADFAIEQFFYVDDAGDLHGPVDADGPDASRSFGCNYGCGIFALRRPMIAPEDRGAPS